MRPSAFSIQLEGSDHFDRKSATLFLVPREDRYRIWSQLLAGDTLALIGISDRLALSIGKVVRRNLLDVSDSPFDGEQRLTVDLTEIRIATTTSFNLSLLKAFRTGVRLPLTEISAIEKSLKFQTIPSPTKSKPKCVFPYTVDEHRTIDLTVSDTDDGFITSLSLTHPFGSSSGCIRVVLREGDLAIGAAVVRLGFEGRHRHESVFRVFGRNATALRQFCLHVARLHSTKHGHEKQRHYVYLLRAITYMAPNVYEEPASYVSGVSYDFIPAAMKSGFFVEIPTRPYRSLYYWKPVLVNVDHQSTSGHEAKQAYRRLRTARTSRAWMVDADDRKLDDAVSLKKWAIADHTENKGRWRSVQSGDMMYFATTKGAVVGAARIEQTERVAIPGYERFPLGFRLRRLVRLRHAIELDPDIKRAWFKGRGRGLNQVPSELHYSIMDQVETQVGGQRMWVIPNPYLFTQTKFNVAPKTVFVVQAWEFHDSIFSLIKHVCERDGWKVMRAQDREGHTVFDDIWQLLNQCEAVIVDFTRQRPNVYLEYGMALVLGKPIVALTQDENDLPSDTPNLKYKKYRGDANAFKDLDEKLPIALRDTIEDIRLVLEQRGQGDDKFGI